MTTQGLGGTPGQPHAGEDLQAYYREASSEIRLRNETQIKLSLAALAGLGVILANLSEINDDKYYFVYISAGFIYAALSVYYLEQDRMIARLAGYRALLETEMSGQVGARAYGWEAYRSSLSASGRTFMGGASTLFRYLPTVGSSLTLGLAYFVSIGANSSSYRASWGDILVIGFWAAGVVVMIAMMWFAQTEYGNVLRSATQSPTATRQNP